jgi:ParB-like chromosome segregation protein Spo0J
MNQFGNHIITGDTQNTEVLLQQLFEDNLREVPLSKLKLPKLMPKFTLRQILSIADEIDKGRVEEQLIVNKDYMITDGFKRYYALKRLGRTRVRVCIGLANTDESENLFSIRNQ